MVFGGAEMVKAGGKRAWELGAGVGEGVSVVRGCRARPPATMMCAGLGRGVPQSSKLDGIFSKE